MRVLLLVIVSLSFFGCVSKQFRPKKNSITIMTYNTENLFDSMDDPKKDDETYLPIEQKQNARHRAKCAKISRAWWRKQCLETDWSEAKIKRKIGRLSDVILQVKDGKGPDILILEEVENLNILERLRQNGLSSAGYKHAVLLEGPDERGIDVGMLSKLPLASPPVLHEVKLDYIDRRTGKVDPNKKARPTRGILQAQFLLPDGTKLTVLGGHFPSQGAPTPARRRALETLNKIQAKLPKDSFIIAGGDFNITAEEDGREGLFNELAKTWLISHRIGCENCQGTHNYRGSWSFLDVLLFSKNFQSEKWMVDMKSIRIPNRRLSQMNYMGAPARFNDGTSQLGVSDHWPLAADIYPRGSK